MNAEILTTEQVDDLRNTLTIQMRGIRVFAFLDGILDSHEALRQQVETLTRERDGWQEVADSEHAELTKELDRSVAACPAEVRAYFYDCAVEAVELCRVWAEPDGREGAREYTERERDIYLNALDMARIAIQVVRGPGIREAWQEIPR